VCASTTISRVAAEIAKAGEHPEVVLEVTCGWDWAVDVLQDADAQVHLAHPLGVKGRRQKPAFNLCSMRHGGHRDLRAGQWPRPIIGAAEAVTRVRIG
jgi:hypothetical protein